MNGIINVLKPPGMTSSDVVIFIRKTLKIKKVGHTGTLDPGASGVLPICIGKATRLFDYIVEKEKEYIAELFLGIKTDTMDAYGKVLENREVFCSKEQLENVLTKFTGNIKQKPPMYSAIKYQGKKLYELARQDQSIELPYRPITIKELSLIEQNGPKQYLIRVKCSKGTYIRVLCNDIGDALGCGAYMSFLLRTASGSFNLNSALTLSEITEYAEKDNFEKVLLPMDYPLMHFPVVIVHPDFEMKLSNGNPIHKAWIQNIKELSLDSSLVRIYCNQKFYGIGSCEHLSESNYMRIRTLLI